jgi:hypothetical protein
VDGGGVHRSLLVLFVLVVLVVPFVFVLFYFVFVVVFVVPFDLLPLGPSTCQLFKKNNCQKYCSTNKNSTQSMSIDRIGKPTTQNKEKPKQRETKTTIHSLGAADVVRCVARRVCLFSDKISQTGAQFWFCIRVSICFATRRQ